MESWRPHPTPDEATAALADAEASQALLVHDLVLPPQFLTWIGAAITIQIATFAVGLTGLNGVTRASGWLVVAGLAGLVTVAGGQLARFRRLNGVWLGGLASRVVGGTSLAASVSYAAALAGATWAAMVGQWWLVPVCAPAGGLAYALSGNRWLRTYRADPATHARGESAGWIAVLGVLAFSGMVLLVVQR